MYNTGSPIQFCQPISTSFPFFICLSATTAKCLHLLHTHMQQQIHRYIWMCDIWKHKIETVKEERKCTKYPYERRCVVQREFISGAKKTVNEKTSTKCGMKKWARWWSDKEIHRNIYIHIYMKCNYKGCNFK